MLQSDVPNLDPFLEDRFEKLDVQPQSRNSGAGNPDTGRPSSRKGHGPAGADAPVGPCRFRSFFRVIQRSGRSQVLNRSKSISEASFTGISWAVTISLSFGFARAMIRLEPSMNDIASRS